MSEYKLINGKTAINFTETKVNQICNKCGSRSVLGNHRDKNGKITEDPGICDGTFGPELKKKQGTRVKKYRKELQRQDIKFTESLFINCCCCDYGFDFMCKSGAMVVIFSWE